MIDRKQIASYTLAFAIALAGGTLGVTDVIKSSGLNERVRALEVTQAADSKRLERIEEKIDKLLERR